MKLSHTLALVLACQTFLYGHGHDEEFHWSKEKSDFANIQIATAGPGVIQNRVQLSGTVSLHPDHLAYVYPKLEGTIWEVRKNVGDSVKKGEVLALIESKEIAEAKANYLVAAKKCMIQKTLYENEAALKGISSMSDYLKAALSYEKAVAEEERTLQNLYILGLCEADIHQIENESAEQRRFLSIKAPLDGKVLKRNLVAGELTSKDKKAFTIANLETLLLTMQIPQSDLLYLKPGLTLEVSGLGGKKGAAEITRYTPIIHEETRMATALAVLKNQNEQWTAGEFVNVHMQTSSVPVSIAVAKEAVQKINGQHYLFIGDQENLVPCIVKVGKMDDKCIEILSGVDEGASYAACNVFCVKADYQKEEAEHHH